MKPKDPGPGRYDSSRGDVVEDEWEKGLAQGHEGNVRRSEDGGNGRFEFDRVGHKLEGKGHGEEAGVRKPTLRSR
ncbi:hypothetical protein DVH24_001562 [Malus domestica]|uniref:Uncharacterized protein n=1 Tax=Malus domestica TaxID=3750 RepID=A0A498K1Y8_MALDO|nr:hypothetical protein DVH24_001562 [Malus domestica]